MSGRVSGFDIHQTFGKDNWRGGFQFYEIRLLDLGT